VVTLSNGFRAKLLVLYCLLSIYSPSISQTTTYYVQTHTGPDFSVRVPVVASVYSAPDSVSLSVSPTDAFICEGTPLIFTANGGADLFDFQLMALKASKCPKQTISNDCVEKGK
jgi:hypothetical protein